MIKPITYQAITAFYSNLYALEVKSRFIDQSKADGYYKNYGQELSAVAVGNLITIKSGAFLVQGRINEIIGEESVEVKNMVNGLKGYVCARIETYRITDNKNCILVVYTASDLSAIALLKQDTYSRESETQNIVYELPLFSFEITNNTISNLQKIILPIEDYTKIKQTADQAKNESAEAKTNSTASLATANQAKSESAEALLKSQEAKNDANAAAESARIAQEAVNKVVEVGGSQVLINGVKQATYDATNVLYSSDELIMDGGGA